MTTLWRLAAGAASKTDWMVVTLISKGLKSSETRLKISVAWAVEYPGAAATSVPVVHHPELSVCPSISMSKTDKEPELLLKAGICP